MHRRNFVAGITGLAVALPMVASAQDQRRRRIAILMGGLPADDLAGRAEIDGFRKGLEQHGWSTDRNISIETRFPEGDIERTKQFAREIVNLRPEVIVARTTPATAALKELTRTIPIVFVVVAEPVSSGFVTSLARPGGNITGFTNFEASIGGKFLDLLKQLSPQLKRAAAMFNPNTAPYYVQFLRSAEVAGQKLGVEVFPAPIQNDADIEKTFVILNRTGTGGILQIPDSFALQRRQVLVSLAEKYRVPVIYAYRSIPSLGGLMAYAVDTPFLFGRAADYVDRLLKGAKPQDLPVQQPTKFEFSVNLKTAKTLGIVVPQSLLVAADEVIE